MLCLAGGGGQHGAVFGLLGSRVTVLDFSENQLERDREAALHFGYDVQLELGDMRELERFSANTFNLVWHAWSINFVPDPWRSFGGVAHVLKPGGWYVLEFANPGAANLDVDSWDGRGYSVRSLFRDGAERKPIRKWIWSDGNRIIRKPGPREWMHSLSSVVGQLSRLGMVVLHCAEYPVGDSCAAPGTLAHAAAYAAPSLRITARLSS